jgi:hypothetical protein
MTKLSMDARLRWWKHARKKSARVVNLAGAAEAAAVTIKGEDMVAVAVAVAANDGIGTAENAGIAVGGENEETAGARVTTAVGAVTMIDLDNSTRPKA